jgi:hypothetical protein
MNPAAPNPTTHCRKALAERSSYVENVLTHQLVAGLAGALWQQDPNTPLSIFNAEVDDSGFDLVLSCRQRLRYLQIKQVHLGGRAAKFSARLDFSHMIGSCVVVIVHRENDLAIDHFLFYGGPHDQAMPAIGAHKASIVPGRRGVDGVRKIRNHYRDIPRRRFMKVNSAAELLVSLFGPMDPA